MSTANWPDGAFVDPRGSPNPPAPPRPVADDPTAIEEFVRLCQRGRIYTIERWIASGRPIQASTHYVKGRRQFDSPLGVAMETKQHDLALLLLCNGYQLGLELENPIARALRLKSREMLELVLDWGADPTGVDPDAVLATNDADMIERFWRAGLDVTADDALAWYLASPASKPVCGWAKRHKDDPRVARALALALVQALWNKKERAAHLLAWAGADPHVRVPMLEWRRRGGTISEEDEETYTAVEIAVDCGVGSVMKLLRPNPEVDDFERLWANVGDPETVDFLMRLRPPKNWSPAIRHNIFYITNDVFADESERRRWCLERIAHHGGRLTELDRIADFRKDVLRMTRQDPQRWLLDWMGNPRFCDPAIYDDLVRTPQMQATIKELRLNTRLAMMRSRRAEILGRNE